jgi:hypothetical protein
VLLLMLNVSPVPKKTCAMRFSPKIEISAFTTMLIGNPVARVPLLCAS